MATNGGQVAMHYGSDSVDAAKYVAPPMPADESRGWYLYGITRDRQPLEGQELGSGAEGIASAGLVAVVRRVSLDEFSPDALRTQAENPVWLETTARQHHAVIAAVHGKQAILPAKFGSVYARQEDVRAALAQQADTLLARLGRVEGCDEWGIHLYGELVAIQQRADEEHEDVRRAREELASASPGRAYLLRRKLEDQRDHALERFLDDLTTRAYACFAAHARAVQVTRRLSSARIDASQHNAELLRAAILLPRDATDAFIQDVQRFAEREDGVHCEYSGPWPPYSFAEPLEEVVNE
jgi:Gas vesicle synthesis protein GvpL/GvpF